MLTEHVYISQFDVRGDGMINVRKTTEIRRNGIPVAQEPWRCVLEPNDSRTIEVLGDEPFYLALAQQVWSSMPQE